MDTGLALGELMITAAQRTRSQVGPGTLNQAVSKEDRCQEQAWYIVGAQGLSPSWALVAHPLQQPAPISTPECQALSTA